MAKMKYQARFFFWLARVNQPFYIHLWGKQNYQAVFVYRSDQGQNLCQVCPKSAVFLQDNITGQIAVIQYSGRASLPQQII